MMPVIQESFSEELNVTEQRRSSLIPVWKLHFEEHDEIDKMSVRTDSDGDENSRMNTTLEVERTQYINLIYFTCKEGTPENKT